MQGQVTQATSDVNASDDFTEDEGAAILAEIQALQPNLIATLQNLDSQHSTFASLPIAGLDAVVESDLNTLNTNTTAFENALLAKAPVSSLDHLASQILGMNLGVLDRRPVAGASLRRCYQQRIRQGYRHLCVVG